RVSSASPHHTDIERLVRRSSLIFPVNVQRFVDKAYLRGADCIIMDLEDSVPEGEKEHARGLIKDYIPVVGKGGGDVAVRINRPIDQAKEDLEASIWPGLTCVYLPKVESAEEVRLRDEIITDLERKRGIAAGAVQIAVAVETALGVINAFEIASASPRMVTIGVGAEDLTQEMGVQTTVEGRELWYARSKVLTDAYAAGIQPMGLVGVEPFTWREPEKAYDAAVNSRRLGYKGAQSIHPAPIPYLNEGFSIPAEEVDYMRRALEAFEEGLREGTASVNVDGRMIDVASAERCRRILWRANAIAEMERRKDEAQKDPDALEVRLRAAIDRI
ncbi:MAG: CoA ester lyase, partial [Candidatus Bathyarchaeota archaeon]|nr:CoA ester lyase [Candidatus Bathyarchaeota archaeon]